MMRSEELRRYRYFAGVPESALDQIAWISSTRPFKAGERLMDEGAKASHLMIVKSGQVDIIYRIGDGREVTAESAVSGDVVAWSALLEPFILTASVVGSRDGELIVMNGGKLRELCETDTWVGYQLMTEIARGLRDRLTGLRVQLAAAK
jgi:CRP-like cAMP-binding protein